MKAISARSSVSNFTKGGENSLWSVVGPNSAALGYEDAMGDMGGARVFNGFFSPIISPKFNLGRNPKIFTSGSCFAREIECALFQEGFTVLSWNPNTGLPNGFFHRYNTFSIINDFKNAFDNAYDDRLAMATPIGWIDYTANGVAPSWEALVELRKKVSEIHLNIRDADVFIITLGLVEVWYDKTTERHLNAAPSEVLSGNLGRFECRITDYAENLEALRHLIRYIREKAGPDIKIIVTVSPVPLNATFSGQDIVIANTFSKAVLRVVAQRLCDEDPLIDYFPSYEIVMNSNTDLAWLPDRRHVRREIVDHILSLFKAHYTGD